MAQPASLDDAGALAEMRDWFGKVVSREGIEPRRPMRSPIGILPSRLVEK